MLLADVLRVRVYVVFLCGSLNLGVRGGFIGADDGLGLSGAAAVAFWGGRWQACGLFASGGSCTSRRELAFGQGFRARRLRGALLCCRVPLRAPANPVKDGKQSTPISCLLNFASFYAT